MQVKQQFHGFPVIIFAAKLLTESSNAYGTHPMIDM